MEPPYKIIRLPIRVSASEKEKQKVLSGTFSLIKLFKDHLEILIDYTYDKIKEVEQDGLDPVMDRIKMDLEIEREKRIYFDNTILKKSRIDSISCAYDNFNSVYYLSFGISNSPYLNVDSMESGESVLIILKEWWLSEYNITEIETVYP